MEENSNINKEHILLRSEVVQEILGKVPHWIIRCGNALILVLVLGLFFLSYMIKYPETISGDIILTTSVATENVVSPRGYKLLAMPILDGADVSKNEVIFLVRRNTGKIDSLLSPIEGKVYFVGFLQLGSKIEKGDLLVKIVPKVSGDYVALFKILPTQVDKLLPGMLVKIQFSENSFVDTDIVYGVLKGLSSVEDEDGNYIGEIQLTNGLIFDDGRKMDYRPDFKARGEVVLEDLRLIDRILPRFRTDGPLRAGSSK